MSVTAVPIRPLKKGSVVKLWLALGLLCLAAAALAWTGTGGQQVRTTDSGLRIQTMREGTGEAITANDLVALHYRLYRQDGTMIQDSREAGQPMITATNGVVPGFAEGLQLMRQGGLYRLWLPPELGYGDRVPPGAPFGPGETLQFEVEILEIAPGMAAMQQMMGPGGAGAGGGQPGGAGPEDDGHGHGAEAQPAR
jgi:FKBP-type peptidyl-prolyl cis-trans isomerase FkpA